jgi:RNA polymerase sigma factor (sigma-70 family)
LHRIAANGFRIPASDREDVVQEALLDFCQFRRDRPATAGLLVRILQRRCQDYWRKTRRSQEVSLEDLPEIPAHEPDEEMFDGLKLVVAWRLISSDCRRILANRFWKRERTRAVAARSGKSYEAVKRFVSRCLARLRQCVEEQ